MFSSSLLCWVWASFSWLESNAQRRRSSAQSLLSWFSTLHLPLSFGWEQRPFSCSRNWCWCLDQSHINLSLLCRLSAGVSVTHYSSKSTQKSYDVWMSNWRLTYTLIVLLSWNYIIIDISQGCEYYNIISSYNVAFCFIFFPVVLPLVLLIGALGTMGTGENYMIFVAENGNNSLGTDSTYG